MTSVMALRMGSEQRHTGPKKKLDVVILEIFPTSDFVSAIETQVLDTPSGRIW